MSLALFVLGLVVAACGVATIGFGIPINEFTLGTTFIVAGTTALTGGLLLVGISALLAELARLRTGGAASMGALPPVLGESKDAIPVAPSIPGPLTVSVPSARVSPAATSSPRSKPEPQVRGARPVPTPPTPGASSVEVSAAAIERLRSTIPRNESPRPPASSDVEQVPLSPEETAQQQEPTVVAPESPLPEPKVTAEDRPAPESAAEALKASRLDFLFRSKPARPARPPENFDAIWPAETRGNKARAPGPQNRHEQVERQAAPTPAPPAMAGAAEAAPERPEVVKSGVVDGMAYTLYADGSIEANLPEGTVRFSSIAELRAHIENSA